jgi:hydrogenase maturation protease
VHPEQGGAVNIDPALPLTGGRGGGRGAVPGRRELNLTATSQVPSLLAFPETREGPAVEEALTPTLSRRERESRRVLVAGVGYSCLTDLSVGPTLVERLRAQRWPDSVVIEDLSYGPIDVLFRLQASPPFRAGIFATAVSRGRAPGNLHRQRWTAPSLPPDALQARVAEAVSGVISLDNLLCILAHFGALPSEVLVLEVEPLLETWGTEFSAPVLAALAAAERAVRTEVERLLEGKPAP